MIKFAFSIALALAVAVPSLAIAQESSAPKAPMPSSSFFVEGTGAYGFQFGSTPYLPDGAATKSKNPLTNGFAVGLTGGYALLPGLFAIANWEYTNASSVKGDVPGAIDSLKGKISYQTTVLGLRSVRKLGPGSLFGELALGVVLPLETKAEQDGVEAAMQPDFTRTSEYNLGFGAHGALGYQFDLTSNLYLAGAMKVKGFSTNNAGKKRTTVLSNGTVVLEESFDTEGIDGMTTFSPETFSVQDLRLQFVFGYQM